MLDNGARGAQRIGADTEHHAIAAAQHARRVGEHIRSSFEHETDHAQRRGGLFDAPAHMLDALQHGVAAHLGIAPAAQAVDHASAHLVVCDQAGDRAAPRAGLLSVGPIAVGDGGPGPLVLQPRGEGVKKGADGVVGHFAQLAESLMGAGDRARRDLMNLGRNMQQGAGGLHHDQPIARPESLGQIGGHDRHPVPAKGDRHAGGELGERGCHAKVIVRRSAIQNPRPRLRGRG